MELKKLSNKCEHCGKIYEAIDINLIIFCNKDCKNDYINEHIKDDIWQIIRNNIDTAKEIVLN